MDQMPYSKPTLTQFGKVTELTHGSSGSGVDGHSGRAGKA
jgi:hypothetical protein